MATSFSQNLSLPSPASGDANWGITENTARTLLDSAVAGVLAVSVYGTSAGSGTSGNFVLSYNQGATDQERSAHFNFTSASGALTTSINVLMPNGQSRAFSAINNTSGAFPLSVGVNTGSGVPAGATVSIPSGYSMELISDGTNITQRVTAISGGNFSNPTFSNPTATTALGGMFALRGYLGGFSISNDSVSSSTVIDVSPGACTDGTNAFMFSTASGTINCATTGANALDTGTLGSSTWYHAFAISQASGASGAFLASLSPTSPTMPGAYTLKRRIGSFKTDASSHILAFTQYADEFFWTTVPALDVSVGTIIGSAASTFSIASVPSGISVEAILHASIISANAASNETIYLSPITSADQGPNLNVTPLGTLLVSTPTVANTQVGAQARIITSTSGQIRARLGGGGTGVALYIVGIGWRDFLGRYS